ncbi:MAG TPA: 4-alpha-glucanotransferase [Paludibacteraceae bacterium]|nr:4-alpha-glucanotransferase [Paludibacteraceae bacterium]HQB68561.1 4-alpha-glucanotransferase [Paludibacteraceae bacterium]HRS67062.1 4-alpha-glucanotransferase [Paludibacteraceae bacterium]
MKLHFKISYFTRWGQNVYVVGNIPELGNNDVEKAVPMHFVPSETWELVLPVMLKTTKELQYRYFVKNANSHTEIWEWGEGRSVSINPKEFTQLTFIDAWNSVSVLDNVFLTAPFQEVLLKRDAFEGTKSHQTSTHVFRVKAPLLKLNEVLCLLGNCSVLGSWDTHKALLMTYDKTSWKLSVDLSKEKGDVHYKYGVWNTDSKKFSRFEYGDNRIVPGASKKGQVVVTDTFARLDNQSFHGAGVSIPVFSLRSEKSFGVGDFVDLKLMIDWAKYVGMKLIQVLPLNDTIGTHSDADVLPYAAISAFALNPLFLNLERIQLPKTHPLQKQYTNEQKRLNALPLMDFMSVITYKLHYVKEAYLLQKKEFLTDENFNRFFKDNAYWLKPYAVYCCLRDKFKTCDYRQWNDFAVYNEAKVAPLMEPTHAWFDEVAVHWFTQYQLHLQLQEAVRYAHEQGVVLKGDIPIGVNRNSVDTWVAPELFNMDMQAGAPPDMFAVKGQNWELPTYNWDVIERTDFDWWKKRFQQMSCYFDTFRIDHILGFFRIWQIPMEQEEGIMGYLNPSIPLYVDEFESRGVWFDYERFTKPYITDHILWENFGEEADWVRQNCLDIVHGFAYRLKKEYTSQKYVKQLFESGKISERVKWGLFDLISNVLLFEVPDSHGRQYYPRYGLESLSTFHALNEHQKRVFRELSVDYFYRRQDAFWYESGMRKLPALKRASNMLICGEDLGMMTHCVTSVMKELSILSLEIQRAPKDDKIEFFHPADAPYLSVVTPSTHDMSTIRGWWEEDYGVAQRFYNSQLGHGGKAPYFCEWWVNRDVVVQHLYSPAMWAIFQWQDLMGMSPELRRENPNDERINVPSNSLHSWRYRMHMTLESLLEAYDFNQVLRNYIKESGR